MKEKRFRVGDTVTFKNDFECIYPDGRNTYYWGGDNYGGVRGVIVRYNDYTHDVDCYTIHVSFMFSENQSYVYMMLESEFLEYNQKEKQYDGDGIKHKFI
jgi:hypothetical protein